MNEFQGYVIIFELGVIIGMMSKSIQNTFDWLYKRRQRRNDRRREANDRW